MESYIEQLLAHNDCVVVPGLGGFVVQREHACLRNGQWCPPRAAVGFNSALSHSDGLLAIAVAQAEACTYRVAAARIDAWVLQLRTQLAAGSSVALGQLGELRQDAQKLLEFIPGTATFLPDNYGFAPLCAKPLLKQVERPLVITLPVQRSWLRYAAVAAVAVALWCVAPSVPISHQTESATFNPIDWAAVLAAKQQAADTVAADSVCAETQIALQGEQPTYHIVVASLDEQAAQRYCNQLHEQGFACAHVLPFREGYARVVLESFCTKTDAVAEMQRVRREYPAYGRAWVCRFKAIN